jgi:Domain of unknown function (DUF4160)
VGFWPPKLNLIYERAIRGRTALITQDAWVTLSCVASLRFGNVLFIAYPQDHEPRHVHGFAGETEVIVDISIDGNIALADRPDCIRPRNAKRGDVRRVLRSAAEHFDELVSLWEKMHA